MSLLQSTILGVAGIVAAGFAAIWAFQRFAVYDFPASEATPASSGLNAFKLVEFPARDGTTLFAWIVVPQGNRPVLLTFGGNFSGADAMARHITPLVESGFGVALLVYRGAHSTPGRTSEVTLSSDALALYDNLDGLIGSGIPSVRRVAYGFSLGTSPAVTLAQNRDLGGVIIEAGFDRLCQFQTRRLRGVPMCRLMWAERHDLLEKIGDIRAPLLMGHGEQDQALHLEWARNLHDAAPDPKEFRVFPTGTHINLLDVGFAESANTFLDSLSGEATD